LSTSAPASQNPSELIAMLNIMIHLSHRSSGHAEWYHGIDGKSSESLDRLFGCACIGKRREIAEYYHQYLEHGSVHEQYGILELLVSFVHYHGLHSDQVNLANANCIERLQELLSRTTDETTRCKILTALNNLALNEIAITHFHVRFEGIALSPMDCFDICRAE
jgi:hypothetical protein